MHTRVLKALVLRYASQDGTLSFDNFIGCAVKLKTMLGNFQMEPFNEYRIRKLILVLDIFQERDPRKTGEAKFDLDAVSAIISIQCSPIASFIHATICFSVAGTNHVFLITSETTSRY